VFLVNIRKDGGSPIRDIYKIYEWNNRATDDSSTHGNGEKSYEVLFSRELHCAFTKAKVANKSNDASNNRDFFI